MTQKIATKLLPIIANEEKLEVSLDEDGVSIKLSTWTDDLGWCGQKTLQINVDMLDDLHRAIAAARYKVKKQQIETTTVENKVIEFPSVQ
jgi:hypothetical protein